MDPEISQGVSTTDVRRTAQRDLYLGGKILSHLTAMKCEMMRCIPNNGKIKHFHIKSYLLYQWNAKEKNKFQYRRHRSEENEYYEILILNGCGAAPLLIWVLRESG